MAWQTPPDFTAGEIAASSRLNILQNNLRYLKGSQGTIALEDALVRSSNAAATVAPFKYGAGFFGFWYGEYTGSTLTVIANGTDEVTQYLAVYGQVYDLTADAWAASASGFLRVAAPGSAVLFNDGVNVLQLTLAGIGSVTIAHTAGSKSYALYLDLMWV